MTSAALSPSSASSHSMLNEPVPEDTEDAIRFQKEIELAKRLSLVESQSSRGSTPQPSGASPTNLLFYSPSSQPKEKPSDQPTEKPKAALKPRSSRSNVNPAPERRTLRRPNAPPQVAIPTSGRSRVGFRTPATVNEELRTPEDELKRVLERSLYDQ